jgi:succinate dehydrogenase/fumarate reductase-like Fe-S protein
MKSFIQQGEKQMPLAKEENKDQKQKKKSTRNRQATSKHSQSVLCATATSRGSPPTTSQQRCR